MDARNPAGLAARPPWFVRIRGADGEVCGAGCLITPVSILTCAHVIESGYGFTVDATPLSGSVVSVHVDLPSDPGSECIATLRVEDFVQVREDGRGDMAVLRLAEPIPGGTPAPLQRAGAEEISGHHFRAHGFASKRDDGVPARGTFSGAVGPGMEWCLLEPDAGSGYRIQRGFSGAPVWDEEIGAVVGIVVAEDAKAGVGTMIPTRFLAKYCGDVRQQVRWRVTQDHDLAEEWLFRVRGTDVSARPGDLFTGRQQELRKLTSWVVEDGDGDGLRIVTGGPGSGKSALLARFVLLADPDEREQIRGREPKALDDPSTCPPPGSVTFAMRCTDLTEAGVLEALSNGLYCSTKASRSLVDELRARAGPALVVIDALDETKHPDDAIRVASELLMPLSRGPTNVKVLVGTQPGPTSAILSALRATESNCIDVEGTKGPVAKDLVDYVVKCLHAAGGPHGWYGTDPSLAKRTAQAIAVAAQPSFLVAGLTAWVVGEAGPAAFEDQSGWERFPHTVHQSLLRYVQRLPNPERALRLLIPLAFARDPGLPRELWEELASSYLGGRVGPAELDDLLGATSLVVNGASGDGGPLRLFHRALADSLAARADRRRAERLFVTVLSEYLPALDATWRGGLAPRHGAEATPETLIYVRRNLVAHILRAGLPSQAHDIMTRVSLAKDGTPTGLAWLQAREAAGELTGYYADVTACLMDAMTRLAGLEDLRDDPKSISGVIALWLMQASLLDDARQLPLERVLSWAMRSPEATEVARDLIRRRDPTARVTALIDLAGVLDGQRRLDALHEAVRTVDDVPWERAQGELLLKLSHVPTELLPAVVSRIARLQPRVGIPTLEQFALACPLASLQHLDEMERILDDDLRKVLTIAIDVRRSARGSDDRGAPLPSDSEPSEVPAVPTAHPRPLPWRAARPENLVLIGDESQRGRALGALGARLTTAEARAVTKALTELRRERRLPILVDLAPCLPADVAEEVYRSERRAVDKDVGPLQQVYPRALGALVPALPVELWSDAVEALRTLPANGWVDARAGLLASLARLGPAVKKDFSLAMGGDVEQWVEQGKAPSRIPSQRTSPEEFTPVRVRERVPVGGPGSAAPDNYRALLGGAAFLRAVSLISDAADASAGSQTELLRSALVACVEIPSDQVRAEVLFTAIPLLPNELLEQAVEIARNLRDRRNQRHLFAPFAERLTRVEGADAALLAWQLLCPADTGAAVSRVSVLDDITAGAGLVGVLGGATLSALISSAIVATAVTWP